MPLSPDSEQGRGGTDGSVSLLQATESPLLDEDPHMIPLVSFSCLERNQDSW